VLGSFLVAIVLLALFVRRCNTVEVPLLDLSLLRLPFVVAANVAGFFFAGGFFAMFFTNTQWLQHAWNYSTSGSGLAFAPGPLTAAIVAAPAGRAAERFGQKIIICLGAFFLGGGILAMQFTITRTPDYWVHYFPYMVITGAGVGLCISTLSGAASAYLPPTRFAMGSALSSTGRQVGSALGLALVVAIVTPSLRSIGMAMEIAKKTQTPFDINSVDLGGFHHAWWMVTIAMAVCALAMIVLFRRPTAEQMAISNDVTLSK
jgi:MFS family permease